MKMEEGERMTHRDGLTATCRHFQTRKDYRGGHWVQCAMGQIAFETAWERNQYYKQICCRGGRMCERLNIRDSMKKEMTHQ